MLSQKYKHEGNEFKILLFGINKFFSILSFVSGLRKFFFEKKKYLDTEPLFFLSIFPFSFFWICELFDLRKCMAVETNKCKTTACVAMQTVGDQKLKLNEHSFNVTSLI